MLDGYWDEVEHRMIPVRSPFTVATQRSMAHCRRFLPEFSDLRYQCAGCLDRVLLEDY